jgi:hypothetical protein
MKLLPDIQISLVRHLLITELVLQFKDMVEVLCNLILVLTSYVLKFFLEQLVLPSKLQGHFLLLVVASLKLCRLVLKKI